MKPVIVCDMQRIAGLFFCRNVRFPLLCDGAEGFLRNF